MIPDVRGGRHEQPLGTYSFLPWLRQGLANQITTADSDPSVQAARDGATSSSQLTGEPVAGGGTLTADVDRDGRAVRAGRHRRHRPARDLRDRAARLDHELRAELPAVRRVLRRGLPVALHAGRARRGAARLRPWLALVVLDGGRVRATGANLAGQAAAVHRRRRPRRAFPPADAAVGLGARARQPRPRRRATTSSSSTDMDAVLPRLRGGARRRTRTSPTRALLCPRKLGDEHAPTTRSSCRRSRPAGSPGSGSTRRGAPHATFSAWATYAGASPSRRASRTTTAGTSAPARSGDFEYLVRLLKPQPVDERVGTRDMDVQRPGSEPARASTDADLGGVLQARRRAARAAPDLHDEELEERRASTRTGPSRTRSRSSTRSRRSSTSPTTTRSSPRRPPTPHARPRRRASRTTPIR